MDALLKWAAIGACLLIVAASICRVSKMQWRSSRFAWFLVYVAAAVFAFGTALDLLIGYRVSWYTLVGIGGLGLYVLVTWRQWAASDPPLETCSRRGELRRRNGGAV